MFIMWSTLIPDHLSYEITKLIYNLHIYSASFVSEVCYNIVVDKILCGALVVCCQPKLDSVFKFVARNFIVFDEFQEFNNLILNVSFIIVKPD